MKLVVLRHGRQRWRRGSPSPRGRRGRIPEARAVRACAGSRAVLADDDAGARAATRPGSPARSRRGSSRIAPRRRDARRRRCGSAAPVIAVAVGPRLDSGRSTPARRSTASTRARARVTRRIPARRAPRRTTSGSAPAPSGSPTTRAPACCGSRPRRTGSSRASRSATGPRTWPSPETQRLGDRPTATTASTASTRRRTRRPGSRPSAAAMPRPSGWRSSAAASGSPGAASRCSRSIPRRARPAHDRHRRDRASTSSPRRARSGFPVRTLAVDRTGFPTMTALRRVTTSRRRHDAPPPRAAASTSTASPPASGAVWLADNTQGVLYRVPA